MNKQSIKELTDGFNAHVRDFNVSRTAWLFFDYVCRGDQHSRDRLISEFETYFKRAKKSHSYKWEVAIKWFARRAAK